MTTVLMTTDAVGGVWTYSLELADALALEGYEVVLVVLGPPPSSAQRDELAASRVERSHELPLALEWMADPWAEVDEAGRRLAELEREVRPDVVHLNGYAHAAMTWSAPTVVVAHSDVLSWWRAVHREPAPSEWVALARRVRAGLGACDAVVAPTRAMLDVLRREHVISGGVVIPNARGDGWVHRAPKEPVVVGVGRLWDQAKNVGALATAAALVDWPVVLIGAVGEDGPVSSGGSCLALGPLPFSRVAEWLGRAAIFAAPARYEPFGLAALEAGHSGCALVLGDIPSLREVWGDAAVFVDPDDPDELAGVLRELGAHPERCAELGDLARAHARRYRPAVMARSYGALYDALARTGGGPAMRFVLFCHSLASDWNHGNAHFLRGVVSELLDRGHDVKVFETVDSWSRANLVADHGPAALADFTAAFPALRSTTYDLAALDVPAMTAGADVVIVHEWSNPALVAACGRHRRAGGYRLLFHDTHHRMVTAPDAMRAFALDEYDGVLAFGQVIRDLYLDRGLADRAWTWHEAADTRVFRPVDGVERVGDLVWIGNWGDDERTEELDQYLITPVRQLGLTAQVYGVRYPRAARQQLHDAGIGYGGWCPNHRVPSEFAAHAVTVHVPRRPYARDLPGIPTIRPFEAMACGIPLVSAPWDDSEGLFRRGTDHLLARTTAEMARLLDDVLHDPDLAASLREEGLATIRSRHTCAHRVDELLACCAELGLVERHEETHV